MLDFGDMVMSARVYNLAVGMAYYLQNKPDADAVAAAFHCELEQKPSFTIWTTTPWTLPANLAIAVHARFRYA